MAKSKSFALILGVLIMSFLVGYLVFAWQEPTAPPPGGNVPAPINVGPDSQGKVGSLGIGTTAPGSIIYEKIGTFTCNEGDTPIAYRTYSNICTGSFFCANRQCKTSYHDWSSGGNFQETCLYKDGRFFSCNYKTCYAKPAVRCQYKLLLNVNGNTMVTGNLSAPNNSLEGCVWTDWLEAGRVQGVYGPLRCPAGKFMAGTQYEKMRRDSADYDWYKFRLLCCSL